jgi:hypothetical protein
MIASADGEVRGGAGDGREHGTRIVCELNHMRHFTGAGSMSTINVMIATKRLVTSSLSNSPVKSLARESACLTIAGRKTTSSSSTSTMA